MVYAAIVRPPELLGRDLYRQGGAYCTICIGTMVAVPLGFSPLAVPTLRSGRDGRSPGWVASRPLPVPVSAGYGDR